MLNIMLRRAVRDGALLSLLVSASALGGCSSSDNQNGSVATGGAAGFGAGGLVPGSGGTASAGAPASGGLPGAGGFTPSAGGVSAIAGSTSSGGVVGVGGASGSGTAPSMGGGGASTAGSAGMGGGGTSTGGTTGGPAGPVTFSKNIRLNDDTGTGRQTEVALAAGPNGLALAGWMDERSTRVCAFSFSTDGGMTWSKNVSISNVGQFVGDPAVAIDGAGTMYAVCQQYDSPVGSVGRMRLMTSSDKGADMVRRQHRCEQSGQAVGCRWHDGRHPVRVVARQSRGHQEIDGPRHDVGRRRSRLGNIVHGTAISPSTTGLLHVPYNMDSDRNQLRYLRSKDNGMTYDAPRDLVADMGTFCFSCNPRQHPIVGLGDGSHWQIRRHHLGEHLPRWRG